MTGKGHPLPGSDEARHHEIPEHLEREKGRGDDAKSVVQPPADPVTPDGEPYRYADLGRGPEAKETEMNDRQDDTGEGVPAGTPRDQQQAGVPSGGRQLGGGPSATDMAAPGGSSGLGGYGNTDEQQQQQEATSAGGDGDEIAQDQPAHQDRGQSFAVRESDAG